jgi:hypothetical protein
MDFLNTQHNKGGFKIDLLVKGISGVFRCVTTIKNIQPGT